MAGKASSVKQAGYIYADWLRHTQYRAIAKSGADHTFLTTYDRICLSNVKSATSPLKASILIAKLPELTELRCPQVRILLLPHVERRLARSDLPTDVRYRCSPSCWRNANVICASENLVLRMNISSLL